MRKYRPLIIMGFGIMLMVAGLGYAVVFAGIPGPDDSPAEETRAALHGTIGFAVTGLGVLLLLVGTLAGLIRLLSGKKPPLP